MIINIRTTHVTAMKTPYLHTAFSRFLYRASVLYRLGYANGFREGKRYEVRRRPEVGAEIRKAAQRLTEQSRAQAAAASANVTQLHTDLLVARQEIARLQRLLTTNGINHT